MPTPQLDVFQVIADPSRREILTMLMKDTYNINALAENFEMSRPAVSKHIKIMHNAGFITIHTIGRERHCMLNPKGFKELKNWIKHFDKFWDRKFSNLEKLLNSKK